MSEQDAPTRPARSPRHWFNAPWKAGAWLYLPGFALVLSHLAPGQGHAVPLWAVGLPTAVTGAVLTTRGLRGLPAPLILHRRGVTVPAALTGHVRRVEDLGDGEVRSRSYAEYAFVDETGTARTYTAWTEEGEATGEHHRLRYDPKNPQLVRRARNFRTDLYARLTLTLLIPVPLLLAGLAMSAAALATALHPAP
ncbi:DUF3592 domain-containing protein [Kitasatospora sp. NPDC088391]|uniref:DUF3592 domain-containing protein n=1 Tax=Kitasatospora sp. NPDC088391 TaxID=3364074 RepID=UPI00381A19B4